MATDYDAPRKTEEEQNEDSLEELKARRHDKNSGKVDEDEAEAAESFELPGADLSHEELAVEVKPRQDDEFTCMSCFLVHHRSQLADEKKLICRDCACLARQGQPTAAAPLGRRPFSVRWSSSERQRAISRDPVETYASSATPGGRCPVERA
jgi:hypothetical protein